jgi:hypothetical protein
MGWSTLGIGLGVSMATAQPNIEVRIQSAIQTPNQEFVFGSTEVGQSTPLIVVVRNIGSASLQFPSAAPVALSGGFAEQFALIQPPLEGGNVLSPNGSTAFRVDFAPTLAKRFMGALVSIPTNDPDTPIFNLQLRGVVPVPEMVVSQTGQVIAPQSQLNMPATAIGQTSELLVTIENAGERPLELTAALDTFGGFGSDSFAIEQPDTDTIQPNQAATFVVRFAPNRTGSLTTNVGITSNDIGNFPNGRFTFVVRGVGRAAEPSGGDEVQPPANDEGAPIDEDDAGQDEQTEEGLAEDLLGGSACGFGVPFGMVGCLASLMTARGLRRRSAR